MTYLLCTFLQNHSWIIMFHTYHLSISTVCVMVHSDDNDEQTVIRRKTWDQSDATLGSFNCVCSDKTWHFIWTLTTWLLCLNFRTTWSQHLIEKWNSYLWFAVTYNANIYLADQVVTSALLNFTPQCFVTFSYVADKLPLLFPALFISRCGHAGDRSSMKRCQLPFGSHIN